MSGLVPFSCIMQPQNGHRHADGFAGGFADLGFDPADSSFPSLSAISDRSEVGLAV